MEQRNYVVAEIATPSMKHPVAVMTANSRVAKVATALRWRRWCSVGSWHSSSWKPAKMASQMWMEISDPGWKDTYTFCGRKQQRAAV